MKVYVTGAWREGLGGSFDDLFAQLQRDGYEPYEWMSADHRALSDHEQSSRIFDHIAASRAFVFVIGKPDHHYAGSHSQLGFALGLKIPVIVVDETDGAHVPKEEGGFGGRGGHHVTIGNVHGLGAIQSGQLRIVRSVPDLFPALRALAPRV